jgi:hypothetical protein
MVKTVRNFCLPKQKNRDKKGLHMQITFSSKIFVQSLVLLALILSSLDQASAKVLVEKVDFPKKVAIVKIDGRIEDEEDIEFEKALDQLKADGYVVKNNAIAFNTRGGSASTARKIGAVIRQRRLNTYVGPNSLCASACIYGVIGGVVRNVYGRVAVHRTTYDDEVPLDKIKKFIGRSDYDEIKHVYQMGISSLLTDAITTTPNWASRLLTETELRRWQINSTERLYEEYSFRAIAAETDRNVKAVRRKFPKLKEQCEPQVREFKVALWDCFRVSYISSKYGIKPSQVMSSPPNYLIQNTDYVLCRGKDHTWSQDPYHPLRALCQVN